MRHLGLILLLSFTFSASAARQGPPSCQLRFIKYVTHVTDPLLILSGEGEYGSVATQIFGKRTGHDLYKDSVTVDFGAGYTVKVWLESEPGATPVEISFQPRINGKSVGVIGKINDLGYNHRAAVLFDDPPSQHIYDLYCW
jgi:hypothetical protein